MSSARKNYVALSELAAELRLDRSNMLKYAKKLNISTQDRRTPKSKNQLTKTVTLDDAEIIRKTRQREGFTNDATIVSVPDWGVFYIIQLVPEYDQKRLKLGFTDNLDNRLSQHKTAAPTATVLKSWPCKRVWEKTIIDALTIRHCRLVANEVFECDSYEKLVGLADTIFDILPSPQDTISLTEHAPLAGKNEV